jgi:hypothetical protein
MTISPENVRFHAAGHLSAALILTEAGNATGAKSVLSAVVAYANHAKVNAPPQLLAKLAAVTEAPNSDDIKLLEQWFVDPLNTEIEKSAA